MRTTAAALRELQDYWESLSPKPNIKEIARSAGMSYSTAARYLNGTTKQGLPDSVRALARALGREDIMAEVVVETPTKNTDAWWIMELQRQMREDNLEELDRERQLRKETEARFEKILADKDEHISQLVSRVAKLEEDKGAIYAQLEAALSQRRKYERAALAIIMLFAVYFVIFDLPYPDYGLTEVILDFMAKFK